MNSLLSGADYRADLLLEAMRPAVSDVLKEVEKLLPGTLPTCPSMSQKAMQAARRIAGIHISQSPEWATLDTKERFRLHLMMHQLREFLAVCITVNIMEYPDNHTWFRRS